MRVFVTGASGHIAAAVIPELISAGHSVIGLARSDRSSARIHALGAEVRRGSLTDLDVIRTASQQADGVIHLAFDHETQTAGDLTGAAALDIKAVDVIGRALAGSGKPFVATNATGGIALAGFAGVLTETDTLPGGPRIDTENSVIALAQRDVRSSVVRLPPAVHGNGRYGFASTLIDIARATGTSSYLHDGANRWPAANTRDVAHLYRLALESAPAGSRLHAVAEEGIPVIRIARAIGDRLGLPTTPLADEDAAAHFGFLCPFVALDDPVTAEATRHLLGWTPSEPGLLDDLLHDPDLAPALS